ncbi:Vacuolar sorting protein VPS1 [Klebsormidium nitens]|uniref:Vacuolar sorting protein VPS1 n=1 Tax=Klebsormidium nitens TaxID=105231 RepID=A0A1Y1IT72_KLENI|nr:Vacuolar sorting protein VPS1 [Klebsormidium nitens]|eukprot:GAQ92749.1 Vacuolar sorting protein VPS1 [Klebsormidium nitens]
MDRTDTGKQRRRTMGTLNMDPFANEDSKARYEAYSKLQASAVAFGEELPIPEIVAIGGQSDGKSSLLEALLGFRFNVREVEMGTRRPLMVQMTHDPTALEPRCALQDEDSDEYGPEISPASAVAEAIRARTEEHLKKVKCAVSAKPIVLKAQYAYCPNLTIIDTPGFVLQAKKGEPENTPEAIQAMVKELAGKPNRLILFLQQSSVEWCSSLWLKVAQEVDPGLKRTVIVASKFDNRLKEFAERWEVDRYLSASGFLGETARPFFVALPKGERGTHALATETAEDFRHKIAATDKQILKQLREGIAGGFDEDKYGARVGFCNLRHFLELELQKRYRDAAPATLALLERRCSQLSTEVSRASARLASAADVAALRRAAMIHAAEVARHVTSLLDGSGVACGPDPGEWGRTTDEERRATASAGVPAWPGVTAEVKPGNSSLRLYGGAAFERVLDEFRAAACSLDCPAVSREKVANLLLCKAGGFGGSGAAIAAAGAELGRSAARTFLAPLLETACDRLAHVIRALFDLAADMVKHSAEEAGACPVSLAPYSAFHAALKAAFDGFLDAIRAECAAMACHHLEAATSPFGVHVTAPGGAAAYSGEGGGAFREKLLGGDSVLSDKSSGRRSVEETSDDENMPPPGAGVRSTPPLSHLTRLRTAHSPKGHSGSGREPFRESQVTVPETPSPEQAAHDAAALNKKREYAIASGRLSLAAGGPGGLSDSPAHKKHANAGNAARAARKYPKGVYGDVWAAASEHFGRIREVVVHQMVPATLNAGFLTPCRERLGLSLAAELFACTDGVFMDMFVAPGAVEAMRAHRDALQKKAAMLAQCKDDFRTLARQL